MIPSLLSLIQIHKYGRLDILETNLKPAILEGECVQESEAKEDLCCVCGKSQHSTGRCMEGHLASI